MYCLASFPGPAQLSIASSPVKWERAWYLFSHEWRQDRKGGRKGLIVSGHTGPRTAKRAKVPGSLPAYHTYLASGRRMSYTLSIERVVGWKYAKRTLLVWQIYAIFRLCHAHVRKDTRLSLLFRNASDRKMLTSTNQWMMIMCECTQLCEGPVAIGACSAWAYPGTAWIILYHVYSYHNAAGKPCS